MLWKGILFAAERRVPGQMSGRVRSSVDSVASGQCSVFSGQWPEKPEHGSLITDHRQLFRRFVAPIRRKRRRMGQPVLWCHGRTMISPTIPNSSCSTHL